MKTTAEQAAAESAAQVGRPDVTALVERVIQAQAPAMRMYPDLYAYEVTKALIQAGVIEP